MTATEIISLVMAGYTKEEIAAMTAPIEIPAPAAPIETPAPEASEVVELPIGTDTPEEKTETVESAVVAALRAELAEAKKRMDDAIKEMQENNRRFASIPALPDKDVEKLADEAMSELIRPVLKENDK